MEPLDTSKETQERYLQPGPMTTQIPQQLVDKARGLIEAERSKKSPRKDYEVLADFVHSTFFWKTLFKQIFGKKDIRQQKFNRNVDEIFSSRFATGCTDYSLAYSALARQLGIPATFLSTSERGSVEQGAKPGKTFHGHCFCEVYDKETNSWVLIDPTYNKVQKNYNPNSFQLGHRVYGSKDYVPCYRGQDTEEIFRGVAPEDRTRKFIQFNIERAKGEESQAQQGKVEPISKEELGEPTFALGRAVHPGRKKQKGKTAGERKTVTPETEIGGDERF